MSGVDLGLVSIVAVSLLLLILTILLRGHLRDFMRLTRRVDYQDQDRKTQVDANSTSAYSLRPLLEDSKDHNYVSLQSHVLLPQIANTQEVRNDAQHRPYEQLNNTVLREKLIKYFNDSELRDLCQDLAIDYECLPGQGKSDKAREIVAYVGRFHRTAELVMRCRLLRPHDDWQKTDKFPSSAQLPQTQVSSNFPDKLYSVFIGREQIVSDCLNMLRSPKSTKSMGIYGFGGTGKTALTREIAERAVEERIFQAVFWSTAKRESLELNDVIVRHREKFTFDAILLGIANWLGIEKEFQKLRSEEEREKYIKDYLDANPSIIVLDNLETADEGQDEIVIKLQRILGKSRAICTSREEWKSDTGLYHLHLKGLTEEESVMLMRSVAQSRHMSRVQHASHDQLVSLARAVGGAPLALKLIVGLLSSQDVEILKDSLASVSSKPIKELYRYLFLNGWRRLSKDSQDILFALAQFSDEVGASAHDLREVSGFDIADFVEAIELLARYSFVEVSSDIQNTRYLLHPLVFNFIRSDLLQVDD